MAIQVFAPAKVCSVSVVSPPFDAPILHRFKKCQAIRPATRSSWLGVPPNLFGEKFWDVCQFPLTQHEGDLVEPPQTDCRSPSLNIYFKNFYATPSRSRMASSDPCSLHTFLTTCVNNQHMFLRSRCLRSVGTPFEGDVDLATDVNANARRAFLAVRT